MPYRSRGRVRSVDWAEAFGESHAKLRDLVRADMFDFMVNAGELSGYDTCFFCLGVSSVGISESEYTHLAYDLTMGWARTFSNKSTPTVVWVHPPGGNIICRRMLATLITSAITAFVTALFTLLVQERKMRRDFRLEFMAEQAARELLSAEKWNLRSFDAIKLRLGGFEDNDLRKMLVRAGAVRFLGKNGEELWGLTNRNKHLLNKSD